jgi:catechol 2,3-dioxygenase-like lactoylglutathione lyase family enzyme
VKTDEFRFLIRTDDFAGTVAFWEGFLELERIGTWDREDSEGVILRVADHAVVLIIGGEGMDFPASDGTYVGIEVGDVDAWHSRALAAGHTVLNEPGEKLWGLRSFRLRDPNGNMLYLFTRT